MATRPSLVGNNKPRNSEEEQRDEIHARDDATVDDGRDEVIPAAGASDAARAAGGEDRTAEAARPLFEDDPNRAAIIQSYKDSRDDAEYLEADAADEGDDAANDNEQTAEEKAAAAAAKVAKAKPAGGANDTDDDPLIKLKVDGVEIELPLSQVKATAQMNMAADSRLREANATLDRARAANQNQRAEDRDEDQDDADEAKPAGNGAKTKRTAEDLLPVVDALQAGSPQEAAEQLAELLNSATERTAGQGPSAMDAARAVLLEDKAVGDITQALEATATKFPDIAKSDDPDLPDLMFRKVDREVRTALKGVGYTEEELANVDTQQAIRGYARLRRDPSFADGRKLKPIEEIFERVSTEVQEKYVAPRLKPATREPGAKTPGRAQTVVIDREARQQRKEAAPQQPRAASERTDMSRVGQGAKRQSASDIVQNMARDRGQASAA